MRAILSLISVLILISCQSKITPEVFNDTDFSNEEFESIEGDLLSDDDFELDGSDDFSDAEFEGEVSVNDENLDWSDDDFNLDSSDEFSLEGEDEFSDSELDVDVSSANNESLDWSDDDFEDFEDFSDFDSDKVSDDELDIDESFVGSNELDIEDEFLTNEDELDLGRDQISPDLSATLEEELDLDSEFESFDFNEDEFAVSDAGFEDELDDFDNLADELELDLDESISPIIPDTAIDDLSATSDFVAEIEDIGPIETQTTQKQDPFTALNKIVNMSYDSFVRGGSMILDFTNPPQYTVQFDQAAKQFFILVSNTTVEDQFKRPFYTKDFDQDFGAVSAFQEGTTARLAIQLRSTKQPFVYIEGNKMLISPDSSGNPMGPIAQNSLSGFDQEGRTSLVNSSTNMSSNNSGTPVSMSGSNEILGARTLEEFLLNNNKFYGKPISIQVKDEDIKDVIHFISDETGANIVLSGDVKGKLSLKLKQVPWDQALIMIMRTHKLGYVRSGNIIRITTLDSLRAESEDAKSMIDARKNLSPVQLKVFPLSYAKPDDLAKKIKDFLTPKTGQAMADDRTSSLIIQDTQDVLKGIQSLIAELDQPPTQVMIEGKIVEANKDFTQSIGLQWGFGGGSYEVSPQGGANNGPITSRPSIGVNSFPGNGGVLSTTGKTFGLGLLTGTLNLFGEIGALLNLAETENKARVISSPKVVTMNNEPAKIGQTNEILQVKTTVSDGITETTIERIPVEVSLEVTPQIASDASVLLQIKLLREFAGGNIRVGGQEARPKNTRTAETKVLVKNNHTAVVGGIYQSDATKSEAGVPRVRKIPLLGWLFRTEDVTKESNELMIFLTPRIVNNRLQQAKL